MRLTIDASNIRAGGGVTHLRELLSHSEPERHGITSVDLWAPRMTLEQLPERPWLRPRSHSLLDRGLIGRLLWQRTVLDREASADSDLLFVPGGTYTGRRRPFATMSQNLLPFDPVAASRYGWSPIRARLALLSRTQTSTFRRADGVVFLTEAARDMVLAKTGPLRGKTAVIPHGIGLQYAREPVPPRSLEACSTDRPFRWLYVSIIDVYKHQVEIAEAIALLRSRGLPVALDLVGPAYPPALQALQSRLRQLDPGATFLRYHGGADVVQLQRFYSEADGFVFGSTCETFGIVLLDAMAASLPIVSSDHAVAREVLGGTAALADPLRPASVADAMEELMRDPLRGYELAVKAHHRALQFTWRRCADQTFAFLSDIARDTVLDTPSTQEIGST